MERKRCVGILFGGRSGEHEVSLASARSIIDHIDLQRYDVVPIGITKEGQWIVGGDPLQALASGAVLGSSAATMLADPSRRGLWDIDADPCGPGAEGQSAGKGTSPLEAANRANRSSDRWHAVRLAELDVVFPVLHGTYGEDGTVQGLLELAGIPYVGCGVLASSVAMDKVTAKDVLTAHHIPVLAYALISRKNWQQDRERVLADVERAFAFPVFVKPANLGSSVGISKVHHSGELGAALDLAARYDRRIVVERGIEAREIEVSVLGNDDPIASVPGEVVPNREFYDYQAKYIDDDSRLLIPAPLDEGMIERVKQLAIGAFKALDCAGMARVDFLLDKVTGELWLNELNTIPGFTQISMYPKLWEASGVSYAELIDRLIELAVERFEDAQQTERSYCVETNS